MVNKNDFRVLVIDDEGSIRDVLSASLRDEGYQVEVAEEGKSGLQKLKAFKPHIVFCDIWMNNEMEGLEVLQRGKVELPETEFVMISGHGTIETAVKSTKLGAWDFVEKPLSMDKVLINAENIVQYQDERRGKAYLLNRLRNSLALVGESNSMVNLKQMIARWAPGHSWILVHGEAGTGKSLVSQVIHYFSPRAAHNFSQLNLSKVSLELQEAELFGIFPGAIPGVDKIRKGKLELTHRGTLVLQELDRISIEIQELLLDYLQSQTFCRVGSRERIASDVRLIFTTSGAPEKLMEEGRLHKDLFYRINMHTLRVPSLRERREDLIALVSHFSDQIALQGGYGTKEFSAGALELMSKHDWPGEVRELRNFIERVYILTPTDEVDVQDLHFAGLPDSSKESGSTSLHNFREARAQFEREYLLRKILENQGNITKTAENIGLERSYLHRKIKLYNLESEIRNG